MSEPSRQKIKFGEMRAVGILAPIANQSLEADPRSLKTPH
jgi:hypothetical protein